MTSIATRRDITDTHRTMPTTGVSGRLRSLMAVLVTLLAACAFSAGTASPASAQDASCVQRGSYSTNHGYNVWIPVAGWGATAWRVNPTVAAWDLCDHGALNLQVNVYDANVKYKGGIVTTRVWYYSTGVGWRSAPLVNRTPVASGWYTLTYTAGLSGWGHLDLCRTCRITHVQFQTTVWTRQDASGWTPIANKALTLNLVSPSWSST